MDVLRRSNTWCAGSISSTTGLDSRFCGARIQTLEARAAAAEASLAKASSSLDEAASYSAAVRLQVLAERESTEAALVELAHAKTEISELKEALIEAGGAVAQAPEMLPLTQKRAAIRRHHTEGRPCPARPLTDPTTLVRKQRSDGSLCPARPDSSSEPWKRGPSRSHTTTAATEARATGDSSSAPEYAVPPKR